MRTGRFIIAFTSLAVVGQADAAPRPWQYTKTLNSYRADCILKRQGAKIRLWLELLDGSKAERREFDKLSLDFPICFGSASEQGWGYSFEATAVREALISRLLELNWQKVPEAAPSKLAIDSWYSQEAMREPGVSTAVLAYAVGKCLARFDWTSSRMLANSEQSSAPEKEAMGKLITFLPACVPPKVTVRFDRARLRAIIEETVYHASSESIYA